MRGCGRRCSTRSLIPAAAFSEKVRANIREGGDALVEKVEDLFCDYFCFTGTGTGEDELDAWGGDGFGLCGVEGQA